MNYRLAHNVELVEREGGPEWIFATSGDKSWDKEQRIA